MKKTLLINFILLFVVFAQAQVKPKVAAQPAKPSKQVTINYIIEKLNENCVGKCMENSKYLYKYNRELDRDYIDTQRNTAFYYQSYNIEEKNGSPFIKIILKYWSKEIDYSGPNSSDQLFDNSVEIFINKIISITYSVTEEHETYERPLKTITGRNRLMVITTKNNNIVFYEKDKDITSNLPTFMLPSFNIADEEKLKKAILNLQSYYKEEADPFGQ